MDRWDADRRKGQSELGIRGSGAGCPLRIPASPPGSRTGPEESPPVWPACPRCEMELTKATTSWSAVRAKEGSAHVLGRCPAADARILVGPTWRLFLSGDLVTREDASYLLPPDATVGCPRCLPFLFPQPPPPPLPTRGPLVPTPAS